MKTRQYELPKAGLGDVFNLSSERGDDPFRIERERWQAAERERQAKEYETRMQRTLEECPGFVGADAPRSEASKGRVVIDPRLVREAHEWLKRRFHVKDSLEFDSTAEGLCIEIAPKVRKKGCARIKVSWKPAEQFTFDLQ